MRRRDALLPLLGAPAFVRSESVRPQAAQGVLIGDVVPGRALVWSRSDRPARMIVEHSTTESFRNPQRIIGGHAIDATDFTARLDLTGLPPDQQIFCRVLFRSLDDDRTLSEPVNARFRTPPSNRRTVRFLWTGDTVGQGWGINPDLGGMRAYEAMRRRKPDFFLHSGDQIYADQPVLAEVKLPGGGLWKNVVTEAKSKVAETLDEFRGNYLYNLLDENVRRFNAEVPQVWQWDDHEVLNNWSPGKDLTAFPAYRDKRLALLVARGTRAFLEYAPMRFSDAETERVYRHIPYGPLLDVFVVDMRSYRGPNSPNRQTTAKDSTTYLGRRQLEWLRRGLQRSKALWKIVAADMPLGLIVDDGKNAAGEPLFENSANGDGPPLGRELEIAELLRSMRRDKVWNVVWLTADTHYTAAHFYNPLKARFTDFDAFWEFVSGPIHAGTFGPNALDDTFGIDVMFQKHAPKDHGNQPPSAGLQFFGEVEIDGRSAEMIVRLLDSSNSVLYEKRLAPRAV
ncbi:MAG TPA: alkaline phosphatase D family protein [Bryobacteraceae bacterium]|nr:alkaline phosphatase D family protein [Bryobacteraceae bacterium]